MLTTTILAVWDAATITAVSTAAAALIAALTAGVVAVINAIKGAKTEQQSQANADSLGRLSARVTQTQSDVTGLALNTPPPTKPTEK
jgi:hypothetical protein